jgi:hypothetical protein
MPWTQNAWPPDKELEAAYRCKNGHVVDPLHTRNVPPVVSTTLDGCRTATAAIGSDVFACGSTSSFRDTGASAIRLAIAEIRQGSRPRDRRGSLRRKFTTLG